MRCKTILLKLAAIGTLLLMACNGLGWSEDSVVGAQGATTGPAIMPTPTPDLQPTVEAMVKESLATLLAEMPTPQYWPTYADFAAVALPNPGGMSPIVRDLVKARYWKNASVHIANECVAGRESTAEGFRSFVRRATPSIEVRAEVVIGQMLGQLRENSDGTCVESYMYPKTPTQLILATDLAAVAIHIPVVLQRGLHTTMEDHAFRWFGSTESRREPLLLELCCKRVNGRWQFGENAPVVVPGRVVAPLGRVLMPPEAWVLSLEARRGGD